MSDIKNLPISLSTRHEAYRKIDDMLCSNPSQGYFLTVTKKRKKRSLSANGQQHLWYEQIANYYGDRLAINVKNECKDMFGLPILHNSEHSADSIEFFMSELNYYRRSYENKMKLIQRLPVTSEFLPHEAKMYMDNMIFYYNDIGIPIKYKDG